MLLDLGVGLVAIINAGLGFFAVLRNSSRKLNRSFFAFAIITSLWMIANYIGANYKDQAFAAFFVHGDFFLGTWISYSFWLFTKQFADESRTSSPKKWQVVDRILLSLVLLASVATFGEFLFSTSTGPDGRMVINYGDYFDVYGLVLISGVLLGLVNLFSTTRKSLPAIRAQAIVMLAGLAAFTLLVAVPNLVVPLITTSEKINLYAGNFAYLGIVAFVAITSYTIAKHRMFDIRLALVRTVGYLVTIGLLGGLFSLLVVSVGAPIITGGEVSLIKNRASLLLLVPPTLLLALTFHSIQQAIARITKKVFYQDLYDLREVLDTFSDSLIASNEIDVIMDRSLRVISDAIKPSHSYFVTFDDDGLPYKQIAHRTKAPESINHLTADIRQFKDNPVVREELNNTIPQSFISNDVFLVLRLGLKEKPVGVILFGPKQNGRAYTSQDIDLLRIGAKNLAIALDNAKHYDQITHFAETLRGEVLKATAKLRAANKELKTLDTMKDDFISMASHQLRTPATSVHEALQMMNHSNVKLTADEKQRLAELAEASSEHLVTVVADMLSISRIQAGHFTITKTPGDLVALIEKVLKQTAVLAEQKHIKVDFKKPADPISVSFDTPKINEAVSNYVENAIKYSEESTSVSVVMQVQDNKVFFEVTDQGIGVPETERKNLFGKFYRAGNARNLQPDGNGIGLFVVKSIAEGHGGDAYYKPLQQGSLFGFWLPLDNVSALAKQAASKNQQ